MVTQSTIDVKDSQTKQFAKFPEHTYQRTGPKMSLPFLPGNNFTDPTKTKFHRSQTLHWGNGYIIPQIPTHGIGGEKLPLSQLSEAELDELANFKPSLTYGQAIQSPPEDFIPATVGFDKKVLLFNGYFKQTVHESPDEHFRIRHVNIYYYLEDDSISVVEPVVENSGIPQGKLIKRQRLPKNDIGDHWHWKDLNLGINVTFYGKTFFVYDCNNWTKEFMASEGIILNEPENPPKDPYIESRKQPIQSYKTPSSFDKLRQFIELDRQVIRFFCLWDDRDSTFGELRPVILHYYLVDDTMEICEVHEPNDGRDPFPVLIRRQKMPKERGNLKSSFPVAVMEISDKEVSSWFGPADFKIGETVFVMGRRFLLYDCDEFTKAYYRTNFGTSDFTPYDIRGEIKEKVPKVLPPYNGFGSIEDSMQSCLSLIPQPPKKDFIKFLENDNKVLRYQAVLRSVRQEDKNRKFILSYRLADDMITIYEPPQRNSGTLGGKFLERTKARKPGSSIDNPEFYSPADFKIGATIEIYKHKFVITDADRYVLTYLESFPDIYPLDTINSIREKHGLEKAVEKNDQSADDKNNADNFAKTEYQWRYKGESPEYKWRT